MNLQTKNRLTRRFGFTLLFLLWILGVVSGELRGLHRGEAAEERGKISSTPSVKTVLGKILTPAPLPEFCEAVGTIRSRTTTVLSSKVLGYVQDVLVKEGEAVQKGQILLLLDDRDLAAQVRRAEAALEEAQNGLDEVEKSIIAAEAAKVAAEANKEFAEKTLQRYQLMLAQQAVSRQEFDTVLVKHQAAQAEVLRAEAMIKSLQAKKRQVLAKITQAQAEVANAKIYQGYATIRSPINGIVVDKKAEVGTLAAPGSPLLTIEDAQHYRLEANVPESRVGEISLGMPVRVTLEALGPKILIGTIDEIVPLADPTTRTFVVKVELPFTPGLRSGMYGKACFPVGERLALLLPRSALLERGQLQTVYVIEEKVARLRLVKTGKIHGDQIEILSGLKAGEMVVLEGMEELFDGAPVEVKHP